MLTPADPPDMFPPDGKETEYHGGPNDGERVLVPGGMPPAKIIPSDDAGGYYVRVNDRYVWCATPKG